MHGAPDNYQVKPKPITFRLDDLAEASIRQGALISVDRLGEIIAHNNFANGLGNGFYETSGLGSSVSISQNYWFSDGNSLKLVAGSTLHRYALYRLGIPLIQSTKLGYEVRFMTASDVSHLIIAIYIYTGTILTYYWIKIDLTNSELLYLNSDDIWVSFANIITSYNNTIFFNVAKVVFDMSKSEYLRFRIDGVTYSLVGLEVNTTNDLTAPHILTAFQAFSTVGNNANVYLDSIIITQNEP